MSGIGRLFPILGAPWNALNDILFFELKSILVKISQKTRKMAAAVAFIACIAMNTVAIQAWVFQVVESIQAVGLIFSTRYSS